MVTGITALRPRLAITSVIERPATAAAGVAKNSLPGAMPGGALG